MTIPLRKTRRHTDLGDYGFARVRDKAFDAVHSLWLKRKSQGVKLKDVADKIGRDTGWVSKQLRGPGNWTLRTFGELVEALDGEAEIAVFGLDEPLTDRPNFDAYAVYVRDAKETSAKQPHYEVRVQGALSPSMAEAENFEMEIAQ